MAGTGMKGPLIVYGSRAPLGSGGSENPALAPSLFYGGSGFIDPRAGYNVTKAGAIGIGGDQSALISQVPSSISAVNLAAAQVPTSGTPLTLVSATGAGITVLTSPLTVWSSGNVIPAGALVIDAAPALVNFGLPSEAGTYSPVAFYNPQTAIARALRITSAGNDSAATLLLSGADVFGYPMTQLVTLTNASIATSLKAFKFLYSAIPGGTLSGSNVSIGTSDVYGLPMLTTYWGEQSIIWANGAITANTGYVAADTTSPATNLTGDVRGTYATQSASNGTNRLMVYVSPSVNNLALGTVGMFGQPQV